MNTPRGFTLVEVIIVLALMGILMAIAAPSLTTWRENARNKEVARDILAGLRQARSIAVTEGRPVSVDFNPNPEVRTFSIDGAVTKTFPSHIVLQASSVDDPTGVWDTEPVSTVFLPQGNCTDFIHARVNNNDRLAVIIPSLASCLARIN